ncbi:spore protease YyaC [Paenibacillus pini]|uniref:Spore protease GPR related protein n=1 Tax=Paenibacillus pini JCM 16418 TaxID=1236976 RepID=W7Z0L4_9BACL|nr:spore protease YyaC [Paenibacillus pini]GAF10511.1 spore protease GPR related protein [Paenibacillus pini JCM 16418]
MNIQDPHISHSSSKHMQKVDAAGLTDFFKQIHTLHSMDTITFLCIGTDRSSGDALGPLTGSELCGYGVPHVIGTLPLPCDSNNFVANVANIPKHHIVIAVDACLGQPNSIGKYIVSHQPLIPAQSVGQALPAVGNYSVAAVVNANSPKPYATLQVTSLFQVITMARQIAASVAEGFELIN